ncbi:MAG: DUF6647 family protein [Pseudorhodoplanes sp.]
MYAYLRALLIVLTMTGMAAADTACVLKHSSAAAGASPVKDRCNAPEPADGRVPPQQLDEIMRWITERFDLPQTADRPAIVFETPAGLDRMRNGGFVGAPTRQDAPNAEHRSAQGSVLALYDDVRRTIHLSEDWSGETDADMSALVHELVHHLQNMAGLTYNCAGEREQIAYQAQAAWLRQFGKSLESEFALDGLSVIVHSNCL